MPGSTIPTVVALTARSADRSASANAGAVQRPRDDRSPPPTSRTDRPAAARRLATGCATVTRARPPQAGEDDGVGRATGARHDDLGTGERAPHRELHARPEPGRVAVEADQPAVVGADHVVHRADRCAHRPRPRRRARRRAACTARSRRARASPAPRAAATAPSTSSSSISVQDVARVDARRVECGVVHDLRVPPLERLAEQGDPAGHDATATGSGSACGPGRRSPGTSRSG